MTLGPVKRTMSYQTSENDWVRITSADGFSFVVRRNIAKASGTMKAMLDVESKNVRCDFLKKLKSFWIGSYAEATTGTCPSGQRFAFMNPTRPVFSEFSSIFLLEPLLLRSWWNT